MMSARSRAPSSKAPAICKRFGRLPVLRGVDLPCGGHDHRRAGTERRGQVHADQVPAGTGPARTGGPLTVDGSPVGERPALSRRASATCRSGATSRESHADERSCGCCGTCASTPCRKTTSCSRPFGLAAELDKPVRNLSGGTQQKLNAAVALHVPPPILILDEPTAGLDPVASGLLKAKILRRATPGHGDPLVSHVLSEVEELADDVLLLLDGQVRVPGIASTDLRRATGEQPPGAARSRAPDAAEGPW